MAFGTPVLRVAAATLETLGNAAARLVSPRVAAVLAIVLGVGLATIASRTEDPAYDDAEALAARVREATGRILLPEGFQVAQASRLDPVDCRAITAFVDETGIRIGALSFPHDGGPLDACEVPMPVDHALEWEKGVSRARDGGTAIVNVVVDTRTSYRNVVRAARWLSCEGLAPALIFAGASGELGVVPGFPYPNREVRFHITVTPEGHRVSRGRFMSFEASQEVGYGAGCVPGAEGLSVPLHGDASALERCVARVVEDEEAQIEAAGYRYRHGGAGFTISAAPETPFRDVAEAMVSAGRAAPFAGLSTRR